MRQRGHDEAILEVLVRKRVKREAKQRAAGKCPLFLGMVEAR